MPYLSGISNNYQFQIITNWIRFLAKNKSRIGHWKFEIRNWKFKEGFAFIEIFLGLLVFGVIVIMLSSASGSVFTRRHVDQQAIAAKVASREIESVRNLAFASITSFSSQPCSSLGLQDITTELKDLNSCTISRTIGDAGDNPVANPACTLTNPCYTTPINANCFIKYVSVTVQWVNEKDLPGSTVLNSKTGQTGVTMDTLIYKDPGTQNSGT